jgi:hypothetical protein
LQKQDNQSQWRSTFDRLGPNGISNKGRRGDQNQSNESSEQGKIGPDLLFLQLLETTRTESAAGRKVELNPNIEKLEYPIGSLVLQIDSFQYGYLTNSRLPTTPNMMA